MLAPFSGDLAGVCLFLTGLALAFTGVGARFAGVPLRRGFFGETSLVGDSFISHSKFCNRFKDFSSHFRKVAALFASDGSIIEL